MALKDVTHIHNLLTTLNVFVFVAQNCVSPFFPLYLKYLGLSVIEMSLIRAFQVIVMIVVIPCSAYIMRQNCLRRWRTQFVLLSMLASFCACVVSAIYFQSGIKVNLMHCGNVDRHLTLATWNVQNFSERGMMISMKTVATAASDTENTEGLQVNSTTKINFESVTISNVNSTTNHIPVLYFEPDPKFQLPETFRDNTKHFEINSSTQFATINYSTRADMLSSTNDFQKYSSSPELTSASPKIITEVNHLRESQADGNIEDIFSARKQSTPQQISRPVYHESYSVTESQVYLPMVKHGRKFQLKNKTATSFKQLYNLTSQNLKDLPLFSQSYAQKQVQALENTNVAHQGSHSFKETVQAFFPLLNTARHENSLKHLHGTNFDYLTKLPDISTTRNNNNRVPNYYAPTISPTTVSHTSHSLAIDNFKEIMDFVYHRKPSTYGNHLSSLNKLNISENNAGYRDNDRDSEDEHRHVNKHKKQQYPNYKTDYLDWSRNLNFRNTARRKSATSISHLLGRIKRKAIEVDNLEVAKEMPILKHDQSDLSTGYTNEAAGHDNVAAVATWSWWGYWDVSQVFVEAVVLAGVYEVLTSTALPCVWELWVQVSGRRLDVRGPLQLCTWSACLCLVLVVAVTQPCRLRATVHWGSAAAAWVLALLPALVAVPPVARRARPDKLPPDADDTADAVPLVHSVSQLASGFLAACSSEFLLWHVATLEGSPQDRELLYCVYVSLSSLTEAGVRACRCGARGSIWPAGFTLLGAHFLGAGLLGHAWAYLAVAPLCGASWALTWPVEPVRGWSVGYGLGCLVGGVVAHSLSTASLFMSSATVSCVFAVICQSLKSCRRSHSYSHLLPALDDLEEQSGPITTAVSPADSPDEETEDWLERALMEEQRAGCHQQH